MSPNFYNNDDLHKSWQKDDSYLELKKQRRDEANMEYWNRSKNNILKNNTPKNAPKRLSSEDKKESALEWFEREERIKGPLSTLPFMPTTHEDWYNFAMEFAKRQQQQPQQQRQSSGGMPMQQQQQSFGNPMQPQTMASPPARPVTPPPPPMKEVITVAEENILSTTFIVPKKSTIPSDSSKHKVIIAIKNVAAHLHHECVPKKDAKVFLMATVINTTEYPFLPGIATVYIDNSLSTTFNLTTISPGDKFNCSLGVDKTVKVIYKPTNKAQLKLTSGVFSNYSSTSNEQKIVIKNTKKIGTILITVYEPIPKSMDERIKIRVTAPDPITEKSSKKKEKNENNESNEAENVLPSIGPFLDENHNLMWTENVEAEDEKEFVIKWAVDYPPDEKIKFVEQ